MRLLPCSLILLALAVALPACGGDTGGGDGDGAATVDASTATDAAACTLPSSTISCTVGDNAPCTAVCGGSFCRAFNHTPTAVCSQACTPGSTVGCPTGWTCNNMGQCRPPG